MKRPDVSDREIQRGRGDWYVFDSVTRRTLRGPYATARQARDECFDLPRRSFRIRRDSRPTASTERPVCPECGAVEFGNLTCPQCRKVMRSSRRAPVRLLDVLDAANIPTEKPVGLDDIRGFMERLGLLR